MPFIDPKHGMSKERWAEVCQEVKMLRKFALFKRGVRIPMKFHEPQRMKGAVKFDLPYANTSLPVIIVFPAKGKGSPVIPCPPDMNDNIPPEIYFQHERFEGFSPDLMSYAFYGRSPAEPVERQYATAILLREFLIKASAFQMALLRDHVYADAEVKNAIDSLHMILPDNTQVLVEQAEVHWLVYLDHHVVGSDARPRDTYAVLKGTTSLADLGNTKVSMDLYGSCANFFKEKETKLIIPPFDHLEGPLHIYIMDIKTKMEYTMKSLYLAKDNPSITVVRPRHHEQSQMQTNFFGMA